MLKTVEFSFEHWCLVIRICLDSGTTLRGGRLEFWCFASQFALWLQRPSPPASAPTAPPTPSSAVSTFSTAATYRSIPGSTSATTVAGVKPKRSVPTRRRPNLPSIPPSAPGAAAADPKGTDGWASCAEDTGGQVTRATSKRQCPYLAAAAGGLVASAWGRFSRIRP